MIRVLRFIGLAAFLVLVSGPALWAGAPMEPDDDFLFIHHSVGANWLAWGALDAALVAKSYIDERNDMYYNVDISPDAGRPDSLAPIPGNLTDMNHWILWFNDYPVSLKSHGAANGENRMIMFKSCFPNSDIAADGTEPGDPFNASKTLTNYKAIFRHPNGPGNTYMYGGYAYQPLEDVFAGNPETLFIYVTAPPLNYAGTSDANAHRARLFNQWLVNEWLSAYNAAHPGLNNVAIFDFFDFLAYPDNHYLHPNRLKEEYGGATGDAHPNNAASQAAAEAFATDPGNFLDTAYNAFISNAGQFSISGSVTCNGGALAGVVMNGLPGNPVTNASGQYSASVSAGWDGTATPALAGYTFNPANRSYANVTSNQSAQNYTASLVTYTVSGTVTLNGNALAGVVLNGLPGNPTTNASGEYSATVNQGFSGTVAPVLTGYTFNPANRAYNNVTANQTGQDYEASESASSVDPPAEGEGGGGGGGCFIGSTNKAAFQRFLTRLLKRLLE